MRKRPIFATVAAFHLAGCNSDPLVASCEAAIQAELAAPSTYKRIAIDREVRPSTIEERQPGRSYWGPDAKIEPESTRTILAIEFDASNLAGVPLRQTARCTYVTRDGATVPAVWPEAKIGAR